MQNDFKLPYGHRSSGVTNCRTPGGREVLRRPTLRDKDARMCLSVSSPQARDVLLEEWVWVERKTRVLLARLVWPPRLQVVIGIAVDTNEPDRQAPPSYRPVRRRLDVCPLCVPHQYPSRM